VSPRAVHVVETSRLARGDTIDQGIVARAFTLSHTLIITPARVVDPSNEFDEDMLEFELFMSRREYKAITRRQQRGRVASVNEGKWPYHRAPYGYERYKLPGQKGWSLRPTGAAEFIRDIFRWYASGEAGVSVIVRRLNDAHVPTAGGKDWTPSIVRSILSNPAYAGYVRWGARAEKRVMRDGEVHISRPRAAASEITLAKGIHEPLVSREVYDAAQRRMAENPSRPGPKQVQTANPLAGLVFCSRCGRSMIRRPYGSGRTPQIMCAYTSCSTVGSDLPVVEQGVLDGLRKHLAAFELARPEDPSGPAEEIRALERALEANKKELEDLTVQLQRIYELTEQGVYSSEDFVTRSQNNADRRAAAEEARSELEQRLERQREVLANRATIAPRIRHVLDAYPLAETAAEKNALLRSVLERVVYSKSTRERWSGGSDLTLTLFPRVPH